MRNVPKLRFKEFIDEWEENNILELCSMKARIGWQNLRKEEHLDEGEFYLVTGTDFYLERIKWETAKYVPEERYSQDKNIILKEGDILITKDGSIGKLAFVENIGNKKATLNNGIFRIRIEKSEQFSKYLFYTFLSDRFKNFLKQLTAGSTIVHLYQKDFEKYKVAYPNFKEQQKIANFLSSVDKKISIAEEKLNLFNEYKKGIMQKIFNQELRFKDENGNNYPEWEEKRLGDILIKNKEKNKEHKYNLVQSISNKYGFVNQDEYFEDRRVASKDLKNYYVAQKKLFAYNPSRINVGSLAYKKENSISVISPLYVSFYTKKEELIDIFLLNWFFSLPFIKQMSCSFEGSVRNNLSYETLSNFIINVPCIEEQQKIADFLSAIDTKIEKISDELENLKEFKKGLLQQMFV